MSSTGDDGSDDMDSNDVKSDAHIYSQAPQSDSSPSSAGDERHTHKTSGDVVSLAGVKNARKGAFKQKTSEDHLQQAHKIRAMRERLIKAKNPGHETYDKKPEPKFTRRVKTPEPEVMRISPGFALQSFGIICVRLVALVIYLVLIFSLYRMLLAYQPADHFIYAPADMLASIRFMGVEVPRIVIDYDSLQIATPIILIILQIASPFITLSAIPTYENPMWRFLRLKTGFADRSPLGKILYVLFGLPWRVSFFILRHLWHVFMVICFILPVPLLMLSALEFLPNATSASTQLNEIASYALLTALILGLFITVRNRAFRQLAVTLPLIIVLAGPYVPIWHITKGPMPRENLNPILLTMEVGLCRFMVFGNENNGLLSSDIPKDADPCIPDSGFSPAGDYLFAYPLAAEQGLPLSYFEAFILNDDLVNAVATQTDRPLSYFTVSRNFYQVRPEQLNLSNVDFRGASFVLRDFRNAELAGAQFGCPEALVEGLDFNLSGCTDLTDANFSGADLTDASFERLSLRGVDFTDAQASGIKFSQVDMSDAFVKRANFNQSTLYWVSLIRSDLEQTQFNNATFDRVDMTDATLYKGSGVLTKFDNVTFAGADLGKANFSNSSMVNVNLDAALLIETDLSRAFIGNSSFIETLMTDTNLNQTVIQNRANN